MRRDSELDALLDKLILQEVYPGKVCLTPPTILQYVSARVSPIEHARINAHLHDCPHCRREVHEFREALAWYDEREISRGPSHTERVVGHLSVMQVLAYSRGLIPAGDRGRHATKDLEQHCKICGLCRTRIDRSLTDFERSSLIRYTEMCDSREAAQLAAKLLVGLAASYRTVVRKHIKGVPKRSADANLVKALVLDEAGQCVLGVNDALTVEFGVIKAEIDDRGRLTLELSTASRNFWKTGSQAYAAEAILCHQDKRLLLPPDMVHADGTVLIQTPLDCDTRPTNLPISAIELVIRPQVVG